MNRIIGFIVLICLITSLLFAGSPGVLAAESPASTVSIPQAANYTAISAGDNFMLALKDNGTVAAWGDNGNGQCTVPAGLSGVKAIAAGYNHSVALKEDGTVVAWGDNYYGQCTVPAGLSGVKAVAAGIGHTVALKEDGTVLAWGNNLSNQCTVPSWIGRVKAVDARGSCYTVALREDGTVLAWGHNYNGQCTVPEGLSGVKAIAAGCSHTVALKENGTVVAWGYNGYGQCTVPAGLSGVKAIAASQYRTVALKEDGTVAVWGYNYYGHFNIPTGLSGVKAIAAKSYSVVVLKEDGTIISFGDENYIIPSTKASSANAVTPYNAEFNTSSPESITVKMYAEGSNKLTNIKNGTNPLTSSDYSISGSAITISKDYLSSCFASSDKLSLTFDFDNGADPVLSIEKNDGTKNPIYKSISSGYNFTLALKRDGTIVAWGDNGNSQCNVPAGLSGVKAVAAGYSHSVALKEDGTVTAWGYNSHGECNVPAGLYGVKAISAGQYHTVALKEDGTVVAWGDNTYEQCVAPAGLYGVKEISAGGYFTVALKTDGTVAAWGNNDNGQYYVPAGLSSVKSISAGQNYAVALKEDGTVVAWGYNGYNQCNVPSGLSGVKAVSAGYSHTVALREDGTLITWGNNGSGQCSVPAGLSGVKAVSTEYNSTVVLKDDGMITSFGDKNYIIPSTKTLLANSLNLYSTEFDSSNPSDISVKTFASDKNKLVGIKNDTYSITSEDYSISGSAIIINKSYLSSCFTKTSKLLLTFNFDNGTDPVLTIEKANVSAQNFKAVAVGQYHSVALKGDGTVTAWGYNNYGQCTIPPGLSGIKAVAAGDSYSAALKADGTVVVWGFNGYGLCDIPKGLSGVKAIATSNDLIVALKEDGTVITWGSNNYGQCTVPAGLSGVKAIAAGLHHTVALKENGTVVAWGYNNYGQCTIPPGLSGVKAIAAGDYHTAALKEDGTVVVWGYNNNGQCNIPSGLSSVKALSAGGNHTMALKEDGTVIAWGDIQYDQCKNFNGLTNVKAISTGQYHSIALKENGTIFAWGYNNYGECATPLGAGVKAISAGNSTAVLKEDGTLNIWGNNDYGKCNVPDGLSSVKAVAVGNNHTVALKEDGIVVAWGYNNCGQCNIPSGLSGVKAVAVGGYHTVALKEDGTVVAWGCNSHGDGECNVPAGLSGVKAISCGDCYTVALKEDGTVVAWGYNSKSIPAGLSGVKAISTGDYYTVALKEDGTVVAWGQNNYSQCEVPVGLSGVKAISAGDYYTVALKEDGTIVSWGNYSVPAGVSGVKAISGTTVLKEDGTVIDLRKNCIIPFPKAASTNLINPSSSEFDLLNPNDIHINIDAGAGKLVSIKNGNDALTSSDYTVSGSAVTISKNYLASVLTKTAPLGQKISLTFDFDNGDDHVLTVSISTPAITVDPAEITVGKSNDVMITVNKNGYPVSGGTVNIGSYVKGQVMDNNGQTKVAVTPTTAGDIVINAYDINHNLLTSKTIKAVAAAVTDSSIAPSTDIFNTLSPVDIKTTMTLNGNTLVNIMSGAAPLTKSDYSVNGNIVTINKGFFSYYFDKFGKFKNDCILTFKFSSGKDATFTVKPIFDALLAPDTLTYDSSNPADVKVTMALSGNTLVSIMSGVAPLTKSDYSVNGNVATINKGFFSYYFSKFSNNCSLKFVFSDGKYAFLTVKPYANANDPSISPNTTTCNIVSPEAIQVTMTLNGSTLGSIMNGSAPLTKYDYSVNGNVVTINKGYLTYYFGRFPKYNCNLTFKFSNGKDILLTIKPLTLDSSVSPVEAVYDMTTPQSITVALTLNGNKLTSIKDSVKTLSEGTDYVVSGSSVLLKTDYLNNLPLWDSTLTFNFDAGKSALLKITVKGEVKDSTISPDVATCSVTTPESIKVTMALNGNTLVNTMNGAAPLTKYDYSVSGNVVTINKSYFVYYFGRFPKYNCTLTFKFSNGKDAVFTVKPAL